MCLKGKLYIPMARKLGMEERPEVPNLTQTNLLVSRNTLECAHTLTHRGGSHQLALRRTLACELARGRWQCSHVLPLKRARPEHTKLSYTFAHSSASTSSRFMANGPTFKGKMIYLRVMYNKGVGDAGYQRYGFRWV